MSRKVIRDFIRQADSLDSSQATAYFETIIEMYEDSVHTEARCVATLETDTHWLLIEYRRIVEAKDNSPEEKQKHHIAQSNISQVLSALIASTADKGIYLSEDFIKMHDKVEFLGSEFGEYVRDTYNVRKWKPQHKAPEPQQTINAPSWEKLTDDEKWFFHCKADYDSFINSCTNNKPDPKGVAEYYIVTIHNIQLDSKYGARKQLHKLLKKWGIVKVKYEHFNKVLNQQFRA